MTTEMKKNFFDLYGNVFDVDGEVKLCGRECCRNLITLADKIEPDVEHGNIRDGFMHVDKIKNLYVSLLINEKE